jgi:TolA-binding protein
MSKFLEKYPKSRHIPQILFQMGNSLKELGLKKDSKTIFNTLIKLYPKSGYSKKAKLFLKTL